LKAHPEIFMSSEKELYYFDSDLRPEGWTQPSLEQYLSHFASAGDREVVGEATPSYLRSERAPHAIKAFNPKARILIMLRNPVDVMHSLHSSALYSREPLTDFEAALGADAKRRGPEHIGYRDFVDFLRQVRTYFATFGRTSVHVIIFDDLERDPRSVYENALRFLGASPSFVPEFVVVGANENVRYSGLQKNVARPPELLRAVTHTLIPERLRSRVRQAILGANLVTQPRAPMDPAFRRHLQKEFEPQVEQLSKLLDLDLSSWSVD
jgi:hypothetical protein